MFRKWALRRGEGREEEGGEEEGGEEEGGEEEGREEEGGEEEGGEEEGGEEEGGRRKGGRGRGRRKGGRRKGTRKRKHSLGESSCVLHYYSRACFIIWKKRRGRDRVGVCQPIFLFSSALSVERIPEVKKTRLSTNTMY